MREVILDTETTGLDPKSGDRIVEIAAIEIINGSVTGQNYHVYLDPDRDMPDAAFKVHGLSAEFLTGKPLFSAIVDEFLAFIGGDPLVIHNAEFDMRFINAELERIGRPSLSKNSIVDTLALARRKHPGASNSLDALCGRYGIDTSRRTKHGALVDSEILAEVYMELKGGRQITMALAARAQERILAVRNVLSVRPGVLPARLTPGEAQAHDAFVGKLPKRAIWSLYVSQEQTSVPAS